MYKVSDLADRGLGCLSLTSEHPWEVLMDHGGGLVIMRSTLAGTAYVKSSGVMVLASMGRRVF